MKIVIVNGSARKGNTLSAINAFAEGAKDKNEIEIIDADSVNVSPCKGCGACKCMNGCVAQDDSTMITDKLVAADLIVFASPVYWWGITAQLKTIIDKSYCKAALLKGKKVGAIIVGGAATDSIQYELIKKQFDCITQYLNWDFKFYKTFSATALKDLAGNEAAMAEMKELGAQFE